jgi:hypothetical protein
VQGLQGNQFQGKLFRAVAVVLPQFHSFSLRFLVKLSSSISGSTPSFCLNAKHAFGVCGLGHSAMSEHTRICSAMSLFVRRGARGYIGDRALHASMGDAVVSYDRLPWFCRLQWLTLLVSHGLVCRFASLRCATGLLSRFLNVFVILWARDLSA